MCGCYAALCGASHIAGSMSFRFDVAQGPTAEHLPPADGRGRERGASSVWRAHVNEGR